MLLPDTETLVVDAPVFERTFAPITRHLLALYCGASGDTNPIHVDADFAKSSGFEDVFAHGMLVMSYLGSALEDVVPQSAIKTFSARFVAITQLAASIRCEGKIAEIRDDEVILDLTAADQLGDIKLKGRASVERSVMEEVLGKTQR